MTYATDPFEDGNFLPQKYCCVSQTPLPLPILVILYQSLIIHLTSIYKHKCILGDREERQAGYQLLQSSQKGPLMGVPHVVQFNPFTTPPFKDKIVRHVKKEQIIGIIPVKEFVKNMN